MKKPIAIHSKIGASTCERWWNCPGSVAAVALCPPQKSSSFAQEGTVAHLVGEWGLRTGRDAIEYVGMKAVEIKLKDGEVRFEFDVPKGATRTGTEIEVTDEMAEAVQLYLDTIRADMAQYGVELDDLKIEHRFHLTHIDEHAYGTNDCNLPVFLDRVIVYDYKHGQGVAVDAEENKQLLYYALGAAELGDYDTIEVVIVQPRAVHRSGPVRRWVLSKSDLVDFGQQLKDKIADTRRSEATLNCGPWCKKSFCPAMATCPAVRTYIGREAAVVFEKPITTLPRPETLSPETLRRILDAMPLMDDWLKAVFSYAEQRANNGEAILGYKLVKGREGNRKWVEENTTSVMLVTERGYSPEDIFDYKLLSPAKLEKVLKKDDKKLIESLTTRTEGKTILVPESDPRQEVPPNATVAFIEAEFDPFS